MPNHAATSTRPSLLLHACCAPCSTAVYEKLCDDFDVTVYWYNPNIFSVAEHDKRFNEIKKLSKILNFELIIDPDSTNHQSWNNEAMKQLAFEPEGRSRCWLCYQMRLEKVFQYAVDKNFDFFTTTLTVSPHKNALKIIEIGMELEIKPRKSKSNLRGWVKKGRTRFLAQDFKKNAGYQRSIELSKKYDLYRQNYCGCEYSAKLP